MRKTGLMKIVRRSDPRLIKGIILHVLLALTIAINSALCANFDTQREDSELSRLAGYGLAALKPGQDTFDSEVIGVFRCRDKPVVEQFLNKKHLNYRLQGEADRIIAMISYIDNPFIRQEVINAMRRSRLFARVEAVKCTECGGGEFSSHWS